MQWYYIDANKQQIPFDQNSLQDLVSNGSIHAKTLVWNGSMSDWKQAVAAFPQYFTNSQPIELPSEPASSSSPSRTAAPKKLNSDLRELVRDLASYISARAGWIKFFAVVLIIAGIPNLVILIGAVYIWLGVMLWKAADKATLAEKTGTQEALAESLFQLGRFFKVNGILMLLMLILYVGAIVALIVTGGLAALMSGEGVSVFEAGQDQILNN